MSRDPIDVDDTGEARSANPIRKLYGEGRAEEALITFAENVEIQAAKVMPLEPASEMQHVAGSVLRRGVAQAGQYGAELVVIAIEREPKADAVLEGLPAPGYAFGIASTSDDDETIALALRGIAARMLIRLTHQGPMARLLNEATRRGCNHPGHGPKL